MRSQTIMTFIGTVYNMDHLDEFPIDNPTRVYLVDGSKIGSLVYVGIRRQALSPFPLSTGDVAESDSGSKRGVILEPSSLERPGEVLQPRSKNQRQPKKTPQYRQKNQRRSRRCSRIEENVSLFCLTARQRGQSQHRSHPSLCYRGRVLAADQITDISNQSKSMRHY